MKRLALAFVLAAICGTAHAQRESNVNGTKLLGFCTAKVPVNCDAYISGVADAIAAEGQAHDRMHPYCSQRHAAARRADQIPARPS
jgi:hypothetical protein